MPGRRLLAGGWGSCVPWAGGPSGSCWAGHLGPAPGPPGVQLTSTAALEQREGAGSAGHALHAAHCRAGACCPAAASCCTHILTRFLLC